jgi:hypothetical protein
VPYKICSILILYLIISYNSTQLLPPPTYHKEKINILILRLKGSLNKCTNSLETDTEEKVLSAIFCVCIITIRHLHVAEISPTGVALTFVQSLY